MDIPLDDEPGIELARLYKTRGRNKRAVDRVLEQLKQEGADIPEATIAALYREALLDANATMRQKCRDLYQQFGKQPPPRVA